MTDKRQVIALASCLREWIADAPIVRADRISRGGSGLTMYQFLTAILGRGVICQPDGAFIVLADNGRMGQLAEGRCRGKSQRLADAVKVLLP